MLVNRCSATVPTTLLSRHEISEPYRYHTFDSLSSSLDGLPVLCEPLSSHYLPAASNLVPSAPAPPSPSPSPPLKPTRPISPEWTSSLPILERVDFPPPTSLPPAVDGLTAADPVGDPVLAVTLLDDLEAAEAVLLPPLPDRLFCAGTTSGMGFSP